MVPLYPAVESAWPVPEGYRVRKACRDDDVAGHIRTIYEEFGLDFDLEFEDDLIDVTESHADGAFWVVEDAEGIVATGAVAPNGAARVIKRMYVAPRGRRAGLARGLLSLCLAWGGFAWSELWVMCGSARRTGSTSPRAFAPAPRACSRISTGAWSVTSGTTR